MPIRFSDKPSAGARALQIWQILICKAANRQTMTYGALAHMLGFKGAGKLSHFLGHIMLYSRQNDLPPLTVLVVNEKTSLPGSGLTQVDPNADRERVYAFE
jgi:alkylated DNA nucleotide flippase Atl1